MSTLYQAALLAHAKNPYGAARIPPGAEDGEASNPACGDEIRVKLAWSHGGTLERLTYELHGCAVSAASASMAARRLEGRTRGEMETMIAAFNSRLGREGFEEAWGDFRSFNEIARYPARIHCARLVWRAVEQALAKLQGSHQ